MFVQTLFIASAILTKPDLVDKGAEADVLQVLQGKVVTLKKGFTIVRCRGQSDINENVSLAEATRQEKEFFANHAHFRYYVAFNRSVICYFVKCSKPFRSVSVAHQLSS